MIHSSTRTRTDGRLVKIFFVSVRGATLMTDELSLFALFTFLDSLPLPSLSKRWRVASLARSPHASPSHQFLVNAAKAFNGIIRHDRIDESIL